MGMTGRDEFKELDAVRSDSCCLAREISESAYSWDSERSMKTEIVDENNSVEYIYVQIDVHYTHTHTHTLWGSGGSASGAPMDGGCVRAV